MPYSNSPRLLNTGGSAGQKALSHTLEAEAWTRVTTNWLAVY